MANTFPGVIAFAFMVSMLLAGTILRAKLKFLQDALVPASLIGGIVGFGLVSSGLSFGFDHADFTAFAFHFFTLSFMSLVLTGSSRETSAARIAFGGMWLSIIWVMSLVMQALVGLVIVWGYNAASGDALSPFLGIIATHGFTQGPGQALALGSIWQEQFGIAHASDFGLIYASAGFLIAFAVGVPVARYAVKAGLNSNQAAQINEEFLQGLMGADSNLPSGRQITHSANVDSLAFHISLLGVMYVITDQYLKFVQPWAAHLEFGGVNFGVIFSHNLFFFHGLIICVIARAVMERLGLARFIDDETQRRVTGSAVDLMVVATIMSIQFTLLIAFAVPLLLVCVAVSATTALLCFGFARSLGEFRMERALAIFGCCTGSTGSGILLLRILDPDLSTSVPRELAFFNIAIVFLGFHVLTLMAPVLPGIDIATIVAVYVATFIVGAMALFGIARWQDSAS